jgi:hypothetical protein
VNPPDAAIMSAVRPSYRIMEVRGPHSEQQYYSAKSEIDTCEKIMRSMDSIDLEQRPWFY